MIHLKTQLRTKTADAYVVPMGPVSFVNAGGSTTPVDPLNLVYVITDKGMVTCGAFDVASLERFNYPAARVKAGPESVLVNSIEDLLKGIVKDANQPAQRLGVKAGMTGKEALELM